MQEINWEKFTFRCSSLGYIMSDPKGKSNLEKYNDAVASKDEKFAKLDAMTNHDSKSAIALLNAIDKLDISQGCKTHLADLRTSAKYGRQQHIKNKFMEKGLLLEEDAITQYSLLTGIFHKKNTERKFNDFIQGELDLVVDNIVSDTKVNWDIYTFGRVVATEINPDYHWQLDGYMDLWNLKKGRLIYCLLDTPEHLIKREEKKLMYELFGGEPTNENDKKLYEDACVELRHTHIYTDIPIEEKVRIFEVNRSEERIAKIHKRVEECRNYLINLDLKHYEEVEES